MRSLGLLMLRVVFGLAIAWHGFGKVFGGMEEFSHFVESIHFPLPAIFAWVAALGELLGGLAVAVGFLTRIAALFPAANMVVAILWVHWGQAPFKMGEPYPYGWELPALYLGGLLAVALCGPGKASADALLRGEKT